MSTIRLLTPGDIEPVVELALAAWKPVFDSMARTVGPAVVWKAGFVDPPAE